jgi:hypothetical protein
MIPEGTKSAAGLPTALGEGLLERPHRRILAVVVVADHGLGHGPAHGRRGLGDGVAAQVDQSGTRLRLTAHR